ncbi:MAG: AI-2E family transporter, partial [Candidatus Margulisbacteria bacterium]|nr:AI-2E family transporter [Candidatus Margulisiibacteriota bacterium]
MSSKQIIRLITLFLFFALLYYIQGALFPIVLSLVLFYGLNPLVHLIQKAFPKKFAPGKDIAIIASFIIFALLCLIAFEFIIPSFTDEFNQLSVNLPNFITQIQSAIKSSQQWYSGIKLPAQVDQAVAEGLNKAFNYIVVFIQQTAMNVLGILTQFISLIVIPVIVYYMLKDEEKLTEGILKLIPSEHKEVLRTI